MGESVSRSAPHSHGSATPHAGKAGEKYEVVVIAEGTDNEPSATQPRRVETPGPIIARHTRDDDTLVGRVISKDDAGGPTAGHG
jgi:hypothetical protein